MGATKTRRYYRTHAAALNLPTWRLKEMLDSGLPYVERKAIADTIHQRRVRRARIEALRASQGSSVAQPWRSPGREPESAPRSSWEPPQGDDLGQTAHLPHQACIVARHDR